MRVALLASIAVVLAASDCYSSRVSSSVILPFTDCVRSRGKDGFYRGSIDVTESGSRCMNWTEVAGFQERHPGKGIGEHNHCRNPDSRIRPWCFFRNHKGRIDWGYCDCKQGKHAGPHGVASKKISIKKYVSKQIWGGGGGRCACAIERPVQVYYSCVKSVAVEWPHSTATLYRFCKGVQLLRTGSIQTKHAC